MRRPLLAHAWGTTATLLVPALNLHLRQRAGRGEEVPDRLGERRGIEPTPRPEGPLLWLHAASVGETSSILPVLGALDAGMTTLLTTGTRTSAELVAQRVPAMGIAGKVLHRFAPLDVPAWVHRFLDHWRPDGAAFVESELWPNQIDACRRRGVPMMLVNARLSARSFNYWRRVPRLARHVIGGFTHIQARGEEDAARFRALGAASVEAAGDLKFAAAGLPVDGAELTRLRAMLAGRPVWVAASTHPGEEELIAAVHTRIADQLRGLLTIIVPRHPDRGAALAEALGLPRRAAGEPPPAQGIWLADTLGELGLWYRLCSVAFVGRSLVLPGGGQNPLEPAHLGCALAVGPHTGNFTEHVSMLREARALEGVGSIDDLAAFVIRMLRDPPACAAMGQRAAAAVARFDDLPQRTARSLRTLLPAH